MDRKVSIKIIVILVTTAILTVPSSMLQVSHAQSTKALQDVLAIHNRVRADVNNPPLAWSNSLASQAQAYADQLGSQGYVCCSQALPHGIANGENLGWGTPGFPFTQMVEGSQYAWVSEKPGYNAQTNTCTPVPPLSSCGHYTAMIWRGSTNIGCGTFSGQIEILVCRYDPPGNMGGQTPFSQGAAQAVGEEDSTLALPPQEGVGDGGGGGDTSGDGGGGGDTSGDGGGGGDTSGDGGGNEN
jgi:hypothetical protein